LRAITITFNKILLHHQHHSLLPPPTTTARKEIYKNERERQEWREDEGTRGFSDEEPTMV
jgi:hypothetical protein